VLRVANHGWDIDCPVQGCCLRDINKGWKEEALELLGGNKYGKGIKK
jgi:hypothetical protein